MSPSLFTHPSLSPRHHSHQHRQLEPDLSRPSSSNTNTHPAPTGSKTSEQRETLPPSSRPSLRQSLVQDYLLNLEDSGQMSDPQQEPEHDDTLETATLPVSPAADTASVPSGSTMSEAPVEPSQTESAASETTALPSPKLGSQLSLPHRRRYAKSMDSIPRQDIVDALAPRNGVEETASGEVPTVSLAEILNSSNVATTEETPRPGPEHSLAALTLSEKVATPSTARFPLKSPCFVHQRFDNAVNIDKVLDEVASDDWISHSRLAQTATSVREVSRQLQRRAIKLEVKNVMIVTKARDNSLVYLTRELAEWLLSTPRYGSDLGVNVYVDAKLRSSKRFDAAGLLAKEPRFENMLKYWTPDLCCTSPETFDLVITLGGDGTVLFTSWLFQRVVPPVLSFSLGSLGFLTNFEFSKYKEHLNRIMGDVGMRVNLRMRFTCTVYRADRRSRHHPAPVEKWEQFEVVNELVIDRGPSPYVSNLEVYGDNELLTVVQADGCIFSTPTGSTAYSLSAGGSLIHPSIPAILLTPICPHTLSFRPMVLSDTLLLRIAIPHGSRSTAYCSFDGKGRVELRQGDYVTVEASAYPFPTVLANSGEWFESVRRTLRWNVRGAVQKGWSGNVHPPSQVRNIDEDGTPSDMMSPAWNGEEDDADEKWDIDTDAETPGTDSGFGQSEDGDSCPGGPGSPIWAFNGKLFA